MRLLALTLFAALVPTIASAQGFALTTYNIEELGMRPGLIELSPNYLSLLEFEDTIQSAATGRSDLIQTSVDGRRVILRPTRASGRTDLIVQAGGKTAMFSVEIIEGNGTPRRYVIETPPAPEPHTRTETRGPGTNALGWTTPPEPRSTPAPQPAPEMEESPSLDKELASRGIAGFEGNETNAGGDEASRTVTGRDIPFTFEATVDVRDGYELVFRYTLNNSGQHVIANDSTRLRILDSNDEPVQYTVVRMNPDGALNRINPTKTEYGTVRIPNPPEGELRVNWPIVEIGPGTTYNIDEIVTRIN